MDERLAYFIDRGMGSRLVPNGLRAAGWRVTTMDERYGTDRSQTVDDVVWITEATERSEVLIAKDRKIAKRPLEAAAITAAAARAFVITDAQITGDEMLRRLLERAQRIEALALDQPGPWVRGVSSDGIRLIRLSGSSTSSREQPGA